ncbi:bifunctional diaminohydroxyphosphoribosylaminopyrimidine deaminase/5-amino-6-(5-phosphoribosylamino)uracil reductase RibD [Phenylobacterium sp.]|uniref:bifunctional diaminohydroxyphosphoribosylaminopyrimidine deaminase/5-amino-6-(5-phosphoribosylamino)uracil reductase RibD n=1 Tax=Phenylobacterium sp. TaxID=1871053 RepID=UPI002735C54C|nr:bifunctional diaminohydroxyphosphoribosylaminopyrimidine deaminase/5-amino-6-(5-phosphoribosylamino)uracil reductase RibD [Phenylobacterium sp.]MDP3658966.1 bifunctional diaminohydroxyphosphoribosylaminopyrimidine deaminase/5-amino-6-(5-phosphoribosylamino)uracil reductase RibD [Phenylobacterium sp.]
MSAPDEDLMRRAIALARAVVGNTGDNPAVGCVVALDGQVVGEGATAPGGRPHAEERALKQAGDRARGAVAYVTMEPCGARSAGGRSCAERMIGAGVSRVVVASEDPSTFAGGKGLARLRAAGVMLDLGLLADEAASLYSSYTPAGKAGPPA